MPPDDKPLGIKYLVDRPRAPQRDGSPQRAKAYLPCATEGCPFAVTQPGARHCCASCRSRLGRHSKACACVQVPAISRAHGEWARLRPCATKGCDRAVACHAGLHCCRGCARHRGCDGTCDNVCLVAGTSTTGRRDAARVDRLVTSACRVMYQEALYVRRHLETLRRPEVLRGRPSPAAKEACVTLYESAIKYAQRRQQSQRQRELQLSTIALRERERTEHERRERRAIYEAQNGWLTA